MRRPRRLFEELQKLLKENSDISQIQKILDKLNQNSNNLEKELERTLELFKQLQYEFKLDQAMTDLKEQVEKQKELLEKTESLDKESRKMTRIERKSKRVILKKISLVKIRKIGTKIPRKIRMMKQEVRVRS